MDTDEAKKYFASHRLKVDVGKEGTRYRGFN